MHRRIPERNRPSPEPSLVIMDRADKLSLTISALALIVACASAVFSIHQDRRRETEAVVIEFAVDRQTLGSQQLPLPGPASVGTLYWRGFIANNGSVPVSVVAYELYGVRQNLFTHSRMDQGLFDEEGRPLKFPFTVSPGSAVAVEMRTGWILTSEVVRALKTAFPTDTIVSRRDIDVHLARVGLDLFGNNAELKSYGDDTYTISAPGLSGTLREAKYLISFRTARGNQFSSMFSSYGFLKQAAGWIDR